MLDRNDAVHGDEDLITDEMVLAVREEAIQLKARQMIQDDTNDIILSEAIGVDAWNGNDDDFFNEVRTLLLKNDTAQLGHFIAEMANDYFKSLAENKF
tara:strand:+ start:739 stop:1032 length:294 start_codon:yes stop_codon:yes gene_type:complete